MPSGHRLLLDYFVGARKHGRRHSETERFGGLEVDDQFVLGRRLHRHVSRPLTPENTIDVRGRSSVLVDKVSSI